MSLSLAIFSFVGVETVAAFALETRVTKERTSDSRTNGKTVKFPAVYTSFLLGALYVLAGVLVTINIRWDDQRLPRMSWAPSNPEGAAISGSAIVLIAQLSKVSGLGGTVNGFFMFTALTCANTNLYVASRSLFSLTRSLDGGFGQPWYIRLLAYFGKTNNRKVPLRALMASCIFAWMPFIYLASANEPGTSIGIVIDVLADMGTIGVIIVWACECWAYVRFYHWYFYTSFSDVPH
jgi:amino acid transporter